MNRALAEALQYEQAVQVRIAKCRVGTDLDGKAVRQPELAFLDETGQIQLGRSTSIRPNPMIGNYCWVDERGEIGTGVEIKCHVTIHPQVHVRSRGMIRKFNEIRTNVQSNMVTTGHSVELEFYDTTA